MRQPPGLRWMNRRHLACTLCGGTRDSGMGARQAVAPTGVRIAALQHVKRAARQCRGHAQRQRGVRADDLSRRLARCRGEHTAGGQGCHQATQAVHAQALTGVDEVGVVNTVADGQVFGHLPSLRIADGFTLSGGGLLHHADEGVAFFDAGIVLSRGCR